MVSTTLGVLLVGGFGEKSLSTQKRPESEEEVWRWTTGTVCLTASIQFEQRQSKSGLFDFEGRL